MARFVELTVCAALISLAGLPGPPRVQAQNNIALQKPFHLLSMKQGLLLSDYFEQCVRNRPGFDKCVMNAVNNLNYLFPTGVPDYHIPPFDPFFAKQVVQKRGTGAFRYKLTLRDVIESGWTRSRVIRFKSDPDNYRIRYTQRWPEKFLAGQYEFDGNMAQLPIDNKGSFNLTLYNFTQTTTVTRRPALDNNGRFVRWAPMKVQIEVLDSEDMALHISHLLGGRAIMENVLDRVINAAWRPGFTVLKPTINDIVGTAFTEIFNRGFEGFDLDSILPPPAQ